MDGGGGGEAESFVVGAGCEGAAGAAVGEQEPQVGKEGGEDAEVVGMEVRSTKWRAGSGLPWAARCSTRVEESQLWRLIQVASLRK